jgi:hypothetical protein
MRFGASCNRCCLGLAGGRKEKGGRGKCTASFALGDMSSIERKARKQAPAQVAAAKAARALKKAARREEAEAAKDPSDASKTAGAGDQQPNASGQGVQGRGGGGGGGSSSGDPSHGASGCAGTAGGGARPIPAVRGVSNSGNTGGAGRGACVVVDVGPQLEVHLNQEFTGRHQVFGRMGSSLLPSLSCLHSGDGRVQTVAPLCRFTNASTSPRARHQQEGARVPQHHHRNCNHRAP